MNPCAFPRLCSVPDVHDVHGVHSGHSGHSALVLTPISFGTHNFNLTQPFRQFCSQHDAYVWVGTYYA